MTRSENFRKAFQGTMSAVGVFLVWSTLLGLLLYMPPLLAAVWTAAVGVALVLWERRANNSWGSIQALFTPMARSTVLRALFAAAIAAILSVTVQVWYFTLLPNASPALTELDLYARRPHGWIAIALVLTVVLPAIEEVAFRGRLQSSLVDAMGEYAGITVGAAAFAAVHGSIAAAPFHFLMGLTFGAAAHLSGSLFLPWAMHMGVNASSYLLTAYFGAAMLPSELPVRLGVSPIFFDALSLLSSALTVNFLRHLRTTRSAHVCSW